MKKTDLKLKKSAIPIHPIPLKPRPHVREGLDMAVAITGKSRNQIINDALEKYLPEIATMDEEKRVKLLEEFRKKFPARKARGKAE